MNKNMLETAISEITVERESLTWMYWGAYVFWIFGVLFLWVAGILTFITGIDYLKKSLPYLKDDNL